MSIILLQLLKGFWFIEPAAAEAYRPLVEAFIRGDNTAVKAFMDDKDDDDTDSGPYAISGNTRYSLADARPGSIAVMPIQGAIMKADFCGSMGTSSMLAFMQQADANPNIIGHLLHMDTPGGAVDGTFAFGNGIKALNKPTVTLIDESGTSAGYLIASSTNHIMAASNVSRVGSIGTMMSFKDYTGQDNANGVKTHDVYATASTQKNIGYREALKDNYEPLQTNMLDPMNEQFMNTVARNRYGRGLDKDNTMNGQTYLTANGLKYGLIDSVGTMSDALNKVKQLAKKS